MDKAGGQQDPVPSGKCPKRGLEAGSWQVAQPSRAVRRDWDSPCVSLAAPACPSSCPAAPPAQPGAAAAGQDPWIQQPAAPAGPPAGNNRKKAHETGWKKLLKDE